MPTRLVLAPKIDPKRVERSLLFATRCAVFQRHVFPFLRFSSSGFNRILSLELEAAGETASVFTAPFTQENCLEPSGSDASVASDDSIFDQKASASIVGTEDAAEMLMLTWTSSLAAFAELGVRIAIGVRIHGE